MPGPALAWYFAGPVKAPTATVSLRCSLRTAATFWLRPRRAGRSASVAWAGTPNSATTINPASGYHLCMRRSPFRLAVQNPTYGVPRPSSRAAC